MHQNNLNTFIGFIGGILGGTGSFLLQIRTNFWGSMLIAIITALLCGAAGVAGKEGYLEIKKFIKKRKHGIKG